MLLRSSGLQTFYKNLQSLFLSWLIEKFMADHRAAWLHGPTSRWFYDLPYHRLPSLRFLQITCWEARPVPGRDQRQIGVVSLSISLFFFFFLTLEMHFTSCWIRVSNFRKSSDFSLVVWILFHRHFALTCLFILFLLSLKFISVQVTDTVFRSCERPTPM